MKIRITGKELKITEAINDYVRGRSRSDFKDRKK